MAISPTSDLILDVARAADPQKAMATTRALVDASSGGASTAAFAQELDRLPPLSRPAVDPYAYRNPAAALHPAETAAHKAAVELESVLLKSFVDQMLPKDAVDVFGKGVAGDVWKSMLSEKIANEIAKSGALKLASRLFETHPDLLHANGHKTAGAVQTAQSASKA